MNTDVIKLPRTCIGLQNQKSQEVHHRIKRGVIFCTLTHLDFSGSENGLHVFLPNVFNNKTRMHSSMMRIARS